MKRFLAMICVLSIVLSLGILPASAATGDSMVLRFVSLRTTEGKEGIYFGANFTLTQTTIDAMGANGCYGLALTPYELEDDAAWAENMGSKVQRSSYTGGLTAGNTTYVRSTSLVNILNISNENIVNNNNANTVIYVRPYVRDNNGNYTFGEVGSVSMKQVAQLVDEIYDTLTNEQKKGLLGMYERFTNVMKGWGLTNLKADYTAGNPLILEYRREKVVANMLAQAEILWSFDGTDPIQYSRRPNSGGLEADIASYPSDVYTIYPGRVYKGIPYSHGSAGLDVYYTMGTQNSSGVWVLEGMNSSVLNGGADTDLYNISRMGNDCWDAISWAYETVGSSVSANQTNQVTPNYGMYPVGPYGEGENSLFSLFLSDSGKVLRTFNDIYTNYFSTNAENRQTIYESYAMLQQGDTLVHYVSGAGGHALMALEVNVVRNTDGTINPDQSTVIFIEQGSGHEKAQSSITGIKSGSENGHDQNHLLGESMGWDIPVGDPATCVECAKEAGYDDSTDIWTMNPGKQTATFTELFDDGGYYIPMTSEELRNPTAKIPTSRISDSVTNTANVANIYTGKLSSTYRVSQITLDVFDNAGENVNSVTCFGVQSDLTGAFNLARFISDQNVDATSPYGSVLHGTPVLKKCTYTYNVTDENGNQVYVYTASAEGNYYYDEETETYVEITGDVVAPDGATLYVKTEKTATTTWIETSVLPEGFYSFTLTCKLANGFTKTFRVGYFQVAEGTTPEGNTALLVTAE